jgi:hypothetical protein
MAWNLPQICVTNRKFSCRHMLAQPRSKSDYGVLAQLVERLNGIEGFLLCKSFLSNVTRLLCHKLLSQSVAAGGRHGAV